MTPVRVRTNVICEICDSPIENPGAGLILTGSMNALSVAHGLVDVASFGVGEVVIPTDGTSAFHCYCLAKLLAPSFFDDLARSGKADQSGIRRNAVLPKRKFSWAAGFVPPAEAEISKDENGAER